eukprot:g3847.t1
MMSSHTTVAGFLIEGCHIPDEARRQPEALMGTSTINVVRPILNGWLGGFEGGDSSEIDDLTEEWRARLWPGDLCLYDHSGNQKLKLAQVSNVDIFNCTCDISFFDSDGAQRGLGPFAFVGSSLRRFPHLSSSWDWHLVRKSAGDRNTQQYSDNAGYYSLGSIAAPTARQLLQEPSWISYKAMRYLAAAGKPGGPLSLDIWQGKLAARSCWPVFVRARCAD